MRLVFGAIVAVILLGVYVYLIYQGLAVAKCVAAPDTCTSLKASDFTETMGQSLAIIAGLVSALVIAELSVTKKGQAPAARVLDPDLAEKNKRPMELITGLYLLVWLFAGFSAFLFGYLQLPASSLPPAIAELGKGWLGIAVGAAYAFFGIEQSKPAG
ncbi:MAG: hypothetical protein AAF560_02520 [Acidobacteriota bacterium]